MSDSLCRLVFALLLAASAWGQALAQTLELAAPPDPGPAESRALFAPLVDLLSRETGKTFEYVHPGNRFAYQRGVRSGRLQLLLDDAHFASWRIAALGHVPVVRARQSVTFVAVAMKDGRIYSKVDLIGRPVCAQAPPDLGTVSLLAKFDGPFQVPRIVPTAAPGDRVQRLLAGDCVAAVLARHRYTGSKDIRRMTGQLKIVTQTDAYPGITFTVGPGVPEPLRRSIRTILLSREGGQASSALRERFADGSQLIEADPGEYRGLDALLQDYPGFEQ